MEARQRVAQGEWPKRLDLPWADRLLPYLENHSSRNNTKKHHNNSTNTREKRKKKKKRKKRKKKCLSAHSRTAPMVQKPRCRSKAKTA